MPLKCASPASVICVRWRLSVSTWERFVIAPTYVGRILRLTSVSPDIVLRILDGHEPEGISLAKLRNDLSVLWAEQEWGE